MVHLFSSKPDIIKVRNQGVEGRFLRCKCLDFKHLLIFADIKLCTSWWFTLAVFRQRLKWFPDERYLCPVLYLVIWKRLRDTDPYLRPGKGWNGFLMSDVCALCLNMESTCPWFTSFSKGTFVSREWTRTQVFKLCLSLNFSMRNRKFLLENIKHFNV